MEKSTDPRPIGQDEGRTTKFAGFEAIPKISGEQTSGAFSVVEFVVPPGGYTPPHYHERTDEVSYLLEGELGVWLAEEEFVVGAGSFVVRPKRVPHAFWNKGRTAARFLDMYAPAGFERWFEALERLFADGPPAPQELDAAGRANDLIMLPERAPEIAERHGLSWPPEPPPRLGNHVT